MPSPVKYLAKPKAMKIKYGKGTLNKKGAKTFLVAGTYKRGNKVSHYIPKLDRERKAHLRAGKGMRLPASYHHRDPQASDTPKSEI
jgi:hypothetical protein